jgi:hypothetical protein
MLKKILATISILIMFYSGGTITAAEECSVDHAKLPQYEITIDAVKGLLAQLKKDKREVFGTAQDKFDNVFIWYMSDAGHRCVLLFNNGSYQIMYPEGCVNLYNDGVEAGAFPQASEE